jgi:hypothetical protein
LSDPARGRSKTCRVGPRTGALASSRIKTVCEQIYPVEILVNFIESDVPIVLGSCGERRRQKIVPVVRDALCVEPGSQFLKERGVVRLVGRCGKPPVQLIHALRPSSQVLRYQVEHFLLTPADLQLVVTCRGDANRYDMALLLKALAYSVSSQRSWIAFPAWYCR